MPASPPARTTGSTIFDPRGINSPFDPTRLSSSLQPLETDNFKDAILTAFGLPPTEDYTYHAIAAVTLTQVQSAVDAGRANGLHSWYISPGFKESIDPPPKADIDAYIALFNPKSTASNSLKTLGANAKKGSLRIAVAEYLASKRLLPEALSVPKKKSPPPNPYLDFWAWSCRNLEWAGPTADSVKRGMAHHMLPIFMHHFGCVVPSYEALEVLRKVASGRAICDMGSGNGYWTFMLRRMKLDVVAVDNGQSEYRTMWIADTVVKEGAAWLKANEGGKEVVLLMVYPVTEGGVTAKLLSAYKGSTVCVAGTQNNNGYTGFKDMGIDEYMAKEHSEFEKVVQIPLPSFAGKDEALFVFQRKID